MGDLTTSGVYLGGAYYGVIEDYPWEAVRKKGPEALRKAVAYRYSRDDAIGERILRTRLMLPYRGIMKEGALFKDVKPGIWFRRRHGIYREVIQRPRSPEEAEEYSMGREQNIVFAVMNNEFLPNQFADNQLNMSDIGTDVYLPPIHVDDDPLNMILKLAIRLKGASFAPYGKRLEALAVDYKKGSEGANIRNNTKRAMLLNKTLTPSKMMQYANTWQLETAIIIRDAPDAMHPMHIEPGKMLVIFPNGIPFKVNSDNLIDITDMIAKAVLDSEK